ncbi:monooxygenase [Silicimonas algicola]|uniref:Salicylate hydroxylase n=1 Tax=Silicimonas algicola TaxID=1826607 RepID=A0A316GEB1_9RHOB|nr:FAD-dependent monooxygenase [Silicimonas algicola]AZQ67864.1 monooxygenase [Silicimonas algicola]PWK57710.1 salicylate hydroxylase [Silicimonas algicola]
MDSLRITIAGAGIGGLAAATALARDGHRVRVAEKAPRIEEVGAGIQISPNGAAVMRALGLGDALAEASIRAEAVRLVDGLTGKPVVTMNLKRDAPDLAWHFIHRAPLIEILKVGAQDAGAVVETGDEILPPPAGKPLEGDDLLVGADGLHSKVRARVDDASKPFFTRQVAWRAVLPETDVPPVVEVHMGPHRHLVTYPLPGGRRNIVAVEEREGWAAEGWSHKDDALKLRAAFARFADPVPSWLEKVGTVHLWGLFRHSVADRWWHGRQVILGDAAHPTLPFLAQGANLALEDAWVLARSLRGQAVETALAAYQNERRPRAAQVVQAASSNARNYHHAFPPARFIGFNALRLLDRLAPARLLGRYDWLYRHDVTD